MFLGGAWGSGSKGSYPKQQWTNGGRKTPGSSGTPIGGGGFVNPKATSYGSSFGSKNTYSYKSPGSVECLNQFLILVILANLML